jgi:hypothetical protein
MSKSPPDTPKHNDSQDEVKITVAATFPKKWRKALAGLVVVGGGYFLWKAVGFDPATLLASLPR